jgi:hypothetical protein
MKLKKNQRDDERYSPSSIFWSANRKATPNVTKQTPPTNQRSPVPMGGHYPELLG